MNNIILSTKEDYVREHRKMWNWITDNLDDLLFDSDCESISDAKNYYIHNVLQCKTDIYNDCFCCEYTLGVRELPHHNCYYCPLKWYDNKNSTYFDIQYLCESDDNNDSNWYTANRLYSDLFHLPSYYMSDEDDQKYNRLKELCRNIAKLEEI